ncbi:MAG: hypothetical protein MR286_06855 [Clostridiales bacterium]|nr:hypothetical protein [Clostridiales bacterium]
MKTCQILCSLFLLLLLAGCGQAAAPAAVRTQEDDSQTDAPAAVLTREDDSQAQLTDCGGDGTQFQGTLQLTLPEEEGGDPRAVASVLEETYQPTLTVQGQTQPLAVREFTMDQEADGAYTLTFVCSMPLDPFPEKGTVGEIAVPTFPGTLSYVF